MSSGSRKTTDHPADTARQVAILAARVGNEKKATDIIVQEVRETLIICDYFVIMTGANNRQVDAIAAAVEERLRLECALKPLGREGLEELSWVLLDYGEVVVHIFQPEFRDFYRLENLWSDSPLVDLTAAGLTDLSYSEHIARLVQGMGQAGGDRL
ncbi:MAG: ribosome silencing factor [Actinomycetia bacterium]|nr:ribosome silencing factor [Actinomycetes bacterium]